MRRRETRASVSEAAKRSAPSPRCAVVTQAALYDRITQPPNAIWTTTRSPRSAARDALASKGYASSP